MFKKYSTKEIVFITLMGTLMFVLSFVFGSVLNITLGNPAASGFTSSIIQPIMVVIALLITRKFGVATLMYLIYGVLALPTNMVGGFPGLSKILVVFLMGIIVDLVSYLGRYKKSAIFFGHILMYIALIPLMVYLYTVLGIPGGEKFIKAVPFLFVVLLIEGSIAVFIGFYIHKKIKHKKIIRQITS